MADRRWWCGAALPASRESDPEAYTGAGGGWERAGETKCARGPGEENEK